VRKAIRLSEGGYGGRSSVALTVLKIAVVAPTPIASVATAASVNAGAPHSLMFYAPLGELS
jgi:hypothetical protein